MELLKSDPIIDLDFKPSPDLDIIQYFNRAMLFGQTNYHLEISRLANTFFHKMSRAFFFEEYVWCLCKRNSTPQEVSIYFPQLISELRSFYQEIFNHHAPSKRELMQEYITSITGDSEIFGALQKTSKIINQGINLFGWDKYRANFLNSSQKLSILPLMDKKNSIELAYNIGITKELFEEPLVQRMAIHWKFNNIADMCSALTKNFALQPRVIVLILWYAATTFGFNVI